MNLSIRNKRLLIYLLVSISTGFLLLTIFVTLVPTPLIDREFSHELQEHQNPFLDSMMVAISWFGQGFIVRRKRQFPETGLKAIVIRIKQNRKC
jgi:hypothetical protein